MMVRDLRTDCWFECRNGDRLYIRKMFAVHAIVEYEHGLKPVKKWLTILAADLVGPCETPQPKVDI